MQVIGIDQPRGTKRQHRRKRDCGRISGIKHAEPVDFITDQMDAVLLAEYHVRFECLGRITLTCGLVNKGRDPSRSKQMHREGYGDDIATERAR